MGGTALAHRALTNLASADLVAACATGDRLALGELFERFSGPVYRFLSRLVGAQKESLDDLVQATFLQVLQSAAKYRQEAAVQTWIFAIAANVVRHHCRSEGRRRSLLQRAEFQTQEPARCPTREVERRLLLGQLLDALPTLPPDLRTAFVMCEVEEIPGPEVARSLNWPEGTLWRRLHEARQLLRQQLNDEGQKPRPVPTLRFATVLG